MCNFDRAPRSCARVIIVAASSASEERDLFKSWSIRAPATCCRHACVITPPFGDFDVAFA